MQAVIPEEEVNSFKSFHMSRSFTSQTEVTVLCGGVRQKLQFEKEDVGVFPKELFIEGLLETEKVQKSKPRRRSFTGERSIDDMEAVVPMDFLGA